MFPRCRNKSLRVGSSASLIFLVLLASTAVQGSKVLTLTQGNFYSTIESGPAKKNWFVKFYAEWCGHCKRLRPIWDELADWADESSQKEESLSLGIAKVDATKNRDLADKFKVRGYPTLIYIHQEKEQGQYYRYGGGRTLEEFQAFLQGGFADTKAEPLPAPPGWDDTLKSLEKRFKKEYAMLEEDFNHIVEIRKNAMAALLIIGGVVGCIFGCLMSCVCCRGSGSKRKDKID